MFLCSVLNFKATLSVRVILEDLRMCTTMHINIMMRMRNQAIKENLPKLALEEIHAYMYKLTMYNLTSISIN